MAFKDTLSRIMIEKNIKAAELSRLSGVTEASISEYLRGKKEPLGKQSNAIANALNISLDELWESEYAEKMRNTREQKEKAPTDKSGELYEFLKKELGRDLTDTDVRFLKEAAKLLPKEIEKQDK